MRRRISAIRLIAALIFSLFAHVAFGANAIEKLMMPGELSDAHAKLVENCGNCHKSLERKAQSSLCISCHKEIREDVDKKTGFHGLNAIVGKSECAACHTEHKGRENSIVRLEKILFNHDETDFQLEGRHKIVACESCHVRGKKFSDAAHSCFACHEKDQPHLDRLGNKCETCHSVVSWKELAAFDHNATKFPLRGAHEKVACVGCHVGEIYKGVSTACNDCHAIQDVHGGKFGSACQDCHSVEKWKGARFDHSKQTRFALSGAHAKAQCSDCHGANTKDKVSMSCIDCHKAQDAHKGQLGNQCGDCHGVTTWRQDVKFDHGITDFPLLGLHVAVACESCHESAAFKDTARICASCHTKDDVHAGRFTARCESCHSANGWGRIAFDHGRDTRFKLTGAHAKVGCYNCHEQKNVANARLPTTCYACHRVQDIHRGSFGQDCGRCHTTATFRTAFIRQ